MKHNFNHLTLRLARFITVLLVCLLLKSPGSFAVVTIHEIESSYKGYSVEKIPGVDEFVAAGTFFIDDLDQPFHGYHFLHLDANGYILNSRYVYPNTIVPSGTDQWELRVADIAVEDADNFWIVMLARNINGVSGALTDYVYAEKVSLSSGGLGAAPNQVSLGNDAAAAYRNFYPVHSLYNNQKLYICGYLADYDPTLTGPNNSSQGKKGVLAIVDLSPFPALSALIPWNTDLPNSTHIYDYDMALKMRISSKNTDHLLITGAGNTGTFDTDPSGIMTIRFEMSTQTVLNTTINYLPTTTLFPHPPPARGLYGIDIYEEEGSVDNNVYVLTNQFKYNEPEHWGIVRIDDNLVPHATFDNYILPAGTAWISWAKQFLPDPSPNHGNVTELVVVGERIDDDIPYAAPVPPSVVNVNPFIAPYELYWDNGMTGGTPGISLNATVTEIAHASVNGTVSMLPGTFNIDYYQPPTMPSSTTTGTHLEDVKRLHTFATRDENQNGDDEIVLLSPMYSLATGTPPNSGNHLNTKFIKTDNTGHEPTCQNEWALTFNHYTTRTMYRAFSVELPIAESSLMPNDIKRRVISSIDRDCSGGSYKPAAITAVHPDRKINIYPNPANNEVTVSVPAGNYTFELADMTGKVILRKSGNTRESKVTVALPVLSTGVYLATVATNEQTFTDKLIINQ